MEQTAYLSCSASGRLRRSGLPVHKVVLAVSLRQLADSAGGDMKSATRLFKVTRAWPSRRGGFVVSVEVSVIPPAPGPAQPGPHANGERAGPGFFFGHSLAIGKHSGAHYKPSYSRSGFLTPK